MVSSTGRMLGKYQLAESLAQGGMAEVFKAFQPGVERTVVVKVLHRHLAGSADFIARFQREARAVGSLQNQYIARIIDIDSEGGLHYMVMDYISGGTLSDRLQERSPLAVVDALRIGSQLAHALACAHAKGVIHRDIKPDNILFVDATLNHAVLTDFGLAYLCDDIVTGLTIPGAMIGTPTYMSPEAIRGEPCDHRADIYGLGVVLYEMLTGKPPYVANTPYSMMTKLASEPLPEPRTLNPDLPVVVDELLRKALAKDPAERYQDAEELVAAIRQILGELPGGSHAELAALGVPNPVAPTPAPVTPNPARVAPTPIAVASTPALTRDRVVALVLGASGVMLVAYTTVQLLLRL